MEALFVSFVLGLVSAEVLAFISFLLKCSFKKVVKSKIRGHLNYRGRILAKVGEMWHILF